MKLGLTFQQVQKYENGLNRVAASRLFEIARLLAVPLLKFFPDEGETEVECDVPAEVTPVSAFVATPDGWRLCRAFVRINDPDRQKKLIALVEDIADA